MYIKQNSNKIIKYIKKINNKLKIIKKYNSKKQMKFLNNQWCVMCMREKKDQITTLMQFYLLKIYI